MTGDPMEKPQCTATSKQSGERCKRRPVPGLSVCVMHGGKAPAAQAKAAGVQAQAKAAEVLRAGLAAAYGDEVPDVPPADAMLRAVSWKHAEVLYLRGKVAELDEHSLTWGVVRDKSGGDDYGVTQEARPNVWLSLLHEAERDLVRFSAAARAAGCDEARVEAEKEKVAQIVVALRVSWDALDLVPADRDRALRAFLGALGRGPEQLVAGEVTA